MQRGADTGGISVAVIVHGESAQPVQEALTSVQRQSSGAWSLVTIAGPGGRAEALTEAIRTAGWNGAQFVPTDQGTDPAEALNRALLLVEDDYVLLLDAAMTLEPHTIWSILEAIESKPDADLVYTDADSVDWAGRPVAPRSKPAWSPQFLRGTNYLCTAVAVRTDLLRDIGGFRTGLAGTHMHDLFLRVAELDPHVIHLPAALCHVREEDLPERTASAEEVITEHLHRSGLRGWARPGAAPGHYRCDLVPHPTTVSIIIPTRGSTGVVRSSSVTFVEHAVRSIEDHGYEVEHEYVVVHDSAADRRYLDELRALLGARLQVVEFEGPFNFSAKVNLGVAHSGGKVLVLVNDDTEVISADWLDRLVAIVQEPSVGAVGAKLLYEDGTIQHAGHMLLGGQPEHISFGREDTAGSQGWNQLDREVTGVTAACMAIRRDVWDQVGGMDPTLPNNFNDVDLCWRIRQKGYRIIQTNSVRLHHFESKSRDPRVQAWEVSRLLTRLGAEVLGADPFTPATAETIPAPGRRSAREWIRVAREVWVDEGREAFIAKAQGRLRRARRRA